MNFKLKYLITLIGVASAVNVYAQPTINIKQLDQSIARLNRQTNRLESQVKSLKHEVAYLKSEKSQVKTYRQNHKRKNRIHKKVKRVFKHNNQLVGVPVTTAPYVGVHSHFDGSDLLVSLPSIGEDLRLLQYRQSAEKIMPVNQMEQPYLNLSGKLEAQAFGGREFSGAHSSNIDLSGAEIDVLAAINPWVSGYFALDYDNGITRSNSQVRTMNSRIFLRKGFLTLGNLARSPFYATIGQFYVPFGQYSSAMISSPLTTMLGRVNSRALSVSYQQAGNQGLNTSLFIYRGDSRVGTAKVNQGGFDLQYLLKTDGITSHLGVSFLSNLADSEGMQNTGGATFGGFGQNAASEVIVHRVPAYDIRAQFDIKQFTVLTEYVAAMRRFASQDLTFNGQGAKPSALNLELDYSFKTFGKPSSFGIGYGMTRQALGLSIPKARYVAVYNVALFRDTLESIEFRHDENYANTDTASGAGSATFNPVGHIENTLTAQVGLYF